MFYDQASKDGWGNDQVNSATAEARKRVRNHGLVVVNIFNVSETATDARHTKASLAL